MARWKSGRESGNGKAGTAPDPDRYLSARDGWFHYKRRVPEAAKLVDPRDTVRRTLRTRSIEVARLRRDAFEQADDMYWSGMAAGDDADGARQRYEALQKRAQTLGVVYRTATEIARDTPDEEFLARVLTAVGQDRGTADAVLGAVERPNPTVGEAIDIYIEQIAVQDVANYSEAQRKSWEKIKRRAAKNFIEHVGDPPLLEITRQQAQDFWQWWHNRVDQDGLDPDTARRDFGNMRTLFREYARWSNVELVNPFAGLTFKRKRKGDDRRPPFSVEWIRDRLLAPGAFGSLNDDARLIFLTLIETGCRPSEICNLPAEHIRLGADVPYLRIRYTDARALKSDPSERDIPLVGVSLAAFEKRPQGFARYRDKETGLSAVLMKTFRSRELLEDARQSVYSIRHSMEDRMLEGGLDYAFRCRILGHRNTRPDYGDGGSMEWRRQQLLKIALPFEPAIV